MSGTVRKFPDSCQVNDLMDVSSGHAVPLATSGNHICLGNYGFLHNAVASQDYPVGSTSLPSQTTPDGEVVLGVATIAVLPLGKPHKEGLPVYHISGKCHASPHDVLLIVSSFCFSLKSFRYVVFPINAGIVAWRTLPNVTFFVLLFPGIFEGWVTFGTLEVTFRYAPNGIPFP